MIVDVHSHACRWPEHFTEAFRREAARARGRETDLTVRLEEYLATATRVDKTIVFGGRARLAGMLVPNGYVAEYVAQASDRLIGFVSIDVTEPDYMAELERGHQDLGMRGIKLLPMYAGFGPEDPRLDPVWRYAVKHQLPVIAHSGTTFVRTAPLEFTLPHRFEPMALAYPDLKLVLGHLGHPWGAECVALIRKQPNCYADISARHYRPWQFYNDMMLVQEYGVYDKLLFGSDYPFAGADESIDGILSTNDMLDGTALPRLDMDRLGEVIHRDALAVLGID